MRSRLMTALLAAAALAGCGDKGTKRYEVSGTVTYAGRAVPAGDVTFEPDAAKGNTGPGSLARIVDGKFKTERDKGVVGGPYIVRIVAFDGKSSSQSSFGAPLLDAPFETSVEFPPADSVQTFDIPARPAKR